MSMYPILFAAVACIGLLIAEYAENELGKWINKPVAAAAYVAYGLGLGALETSYGRWLVLALLASFAGDVLLIPKGRRRWFQTGILAFLAAHLLYVVAFLQLPVARIGLGAGVLLAVVVAGSVWWWLSSRLPTGFRRLVMLYIVVICAMLVVASGVAVGSGRALIAIGAVLFAASDVLVARDRFVKPEFANRLLGLPLYFAAQMILAATVAV